MKTRIKQVFVMFSIIIVGAICMLKTTNKSMVDCPVSDLLLENVEALAVTEYIGSIDGMTVLGKGAVIV